MPRAASPASCATPRNSPRPQPRSSTPVAPCKTRDIAPLVLPDALFRAAALFGKPQPVDRDGSRLSRDRRRSRRRRSLRQQPLPDHLQLAMNQRLILRADLLQILPKALLHLGGVAVERGGELAMLLLDAILEGRLQLRNGAKDMDFLRGVAALEAFTPLLPARAEILAA